MSRETLAVCLGGMAMTLVMFFLGGNAEAKGRNKVRHDIDVKVDVVVTPEPPDAPDEPDVDLELDEADFDDIDMDDGKKAGGKKDGGRGKVAKAGASKSVAVKGPVTLRLEAVNVDIAVTTGAKDKVTVNAGDCPFDLAVENGSEVEVELEEFGPGGSCTGPVTVSLPTGSSVDLELVNGGVSLKGSYGKAEIEAVNGDIKVEKAIEAEIEAVSGAVTLSEISGAARVETVSGDLKLSMSGTSPQLEYETVSGELEWSGACGKGCRLKLSTMQGDIGLALDSKSSFGIKYATIGGDVDDQLGLTVAKPFKKGSGRSGRTLKGSYGSGEGQIKVETYQGDLGLKKRP